MDTTATRMTAQEYHRVSTEDDRTQLIDGVIVVNEAKPMHGLLQMRLGTALHLWCEADEGRGMAIPPTSVTVDDWNVYGPDMLWIAERHRLKDLREYPERVPDICVEIRSPSTWHYDTGKKKDAYERGGCPELWLVDDRGQCVLVYRRSRPDAPTFDVQLELAVGDELTSPQLPGFSLALERLFADV